MNSDPAMFLIKGNRVHVIDFLPLGVRTTLVR
jgi:hypothetical protein